MDDGDAAGRSTLLFSRTSPTAYVLYQSLHDRAPGTVWRYTAPSEFCKVQGGHYRGTAPAETDLKYSRGMPHSTCPPPQKEPPTHPHELFLVDCPVCHHPCQCSAVLIRQLTALTAKLLTRLSSSSSSSMTWHTPGRGQQQQQYTLVNRQQQLPKVCQLVTRPRSSCSSRGTTAQPADPS